MERLTMDKGLGLFDLIVGDKEKSVIFFNPERGWSRCWTYQVTMSLNFFSPSFFTVRQNKLDHLQ
jgi:hypothetical protein